MGDPQSPLRPAEERAGDACEAEASWLFDRRITDGRLFQEGLHLKGLVSSSRVCKFADPANFHAYLQNPDLANYIVSHGFAPKRYEGQAPAPAAERRTQFQPPK